MKALAARTRDIDDLRVLAHIAGVETADEAPVTYVTRWRMTVASQAVNRGDRIGTVARMVGYASEFAFARAFKRVRDVPHGHLRRAANVMSFR